MFSGIKCYVCGMAVENPAYLLDEHGDGIYWANPKICEFTDVRLDFCGPQHSSQWFVEKIESRRDVTQDASNQSTG
jgi:hypothetical protein